MYENDNILQHSGDGRSVGRRHHKHATDKVVCFCVAGGHLEPVLLDGHGYLHAVLTIGMVTTRQGVIQQHTCHLKQRVEGFVPCVLDGYHPTECNTAACQPPETEGGRICTGYGKRDKSDTEM